MTPVAHTHEGQQTGRSHASNGQSRRRVPPPPVLTGTLHRHLPTLCLLLFCCVPFTHIVTYHFW